jgi:hypothetical protein
MRPCAGIMTVLGAREAEISWHEQPHGAGSSFGCFLHTFSLSRPAKRFR